MITYPRTDSRALPEDYRGVVLNTLAALESPYAEFAKRAIDEGYVKKKKPARGFLTISK